MVQGPGIDWQKPASRVDSTPFFLAAQRRTASTVKKKLLFTLARKYTRVCGPLCDPSGSSQAMPSLSSASTVLVSTLVLDCNCKPVCSSFNDQAAEQQTYSPSLPQGFFALQKSLRGTAVGMGSPPQSAEAPPAQRNFQRKFALRRVGSYKFVVPLTSSRSKVRNNARLVTCPCRAAPGCQRNRGPFCFGKSPEEPLPRGSFGQLLRGGSTPRFLAAQRSVGSKPTRLAGHCQLKLAPAATDGSKKPLAAALGSKNKKRRAAFAAPKPYSYRGTMIFTAR